MPHSSPEPITAVIISYAAANGFHDEVEVGMMMIIAVSSDWEHGAQIYGVILEGQGWVEYDYLHKLNRWKSLRFPIAYKVVSSASNEDLVKVSGMLSSIIRHFPI